MGHELLCRIAFVSEFLKSHIYCSYLVVHMISGSLCRKICFSNDYVVLLLVHSQSEAKYKSSNRRNQPDTPYLLSLTLGLFPQFKMYVKKKRVKCVTKESLVCVFNYSEKKEEENTGAAEPGLDDEDPSFQDDPDNLNYQPQSQRCAYVKCII